VLIPSSALVYANAREALTEEHPLLPGSPYALSKLAQEMLGRRTNGPLGVTIARAFNHVGPRQDPQFRRVGLRAAHRRHREGTVGAEISVGNLDACAISPTSATRCAPTR
jgi:GDP-4-dehydro-6-deoxy-D-mannose reductase